MNIVLIHIGPTLPSYFYDCVGQIRKYYHGPLHAVFQNSLRTDQVDAYNITHHPLEQFTSLSRCREFQSISFLEKVHGAFWSYAMQRLFILESLIQAHSLTDVVHMENDILIYHNPETLTFKECYPDRVAVNPVGERYSSYAYCWIPDYKAIHQVNNWNLKILRMGHERLNKKYGEGMVNEMLIAQDLVNTRSVMDTLPTLPVGPVSKNFDRLQMLFDGSAWGQYVGGTPHDPPGWMEKNRWVGEELLAGNYSVIWQNQEPYACNRNGTLYKIANLHIHSKDLKRWISVEK